MTEKSNPPKNAAASKRAMSLVVVLLLLAGCTLTWCAYHRTTPRQDAARTAKMALNFSADPQCEISNIQMTAVDSIFDRRFFSEKDSEEMFRIMSYLSNQTLYSYKMAGKDTDDATMAHIASSSSMASAAIQAMMKQAALGKGKGEFSGWKVKLSYDKKSPDGAVEKCQTWTAVDPSGKCVLQSYDFPVVDDTKFSAP